MRYYRNRQGKVKAVRKRDLRVLVERFQDPAFRTAIGEDRATSIDQLVLPDLDYLLRGGTLTERSVGYDE